MQRVELRIPLHVTGFWLPVWRREPLLSGSLGAGLLFEPRVVVDAWPCNNWAVEVIAEDKPIKGPLRVAEEAARRVPAEPACIRIVSPAPLGAGFAVSAAIALGVALGAGLLSGLGVTEAALAAHAAEVIAGTGLGDVVAMLYGWGLEARLSPGGPGVARVESYPVPSHEVVAVVLGAMDTAEMHRLLGERLHSIAAPHYARFVSSPSLTSFLREARLFSIEAGMAPQSLVKILDGFLEEGLIEGWYVKKKVAVLFPVPDKVSVVEERVKQLLGAKTYRIRVTSTPLEVVIV